MEKEMDDETSQLWILRHLRLLLNDVDDSILSSFILHQDCTPLRNFVNGYGKRRALYILVKRTSTTGSTSALLPHTIATDKEQKAWKAPAPVTVKKAMGKKLTITKRKKKAARNMNSTEAEPTKDEQVIAEKSANALQDETTPQVSLFWCDTQLPTYSNEFVFIVTKTQTSSNVGFDQLFHIGICNKGDIYWRLIDLAIAILGREVDDYLKVDLLLLFSSAGFR
uniref:MULE domain-containing protein n=1 Tax=Ascaris lumbricoides TaxID=6252 RepID=A0A0M3IG98_ASCLU